MSERPTIAGPAWVALLPQSQQSQQRQLHKAKAAHTQSMIECGCGPEGEGEWLLLWKEDRRGRAKKAPNRSSQNSFQRLHPVRS